MPLAVGNYACQVVHCKQVAFQLPSVYISDQGYLLASFLRFSSVVIDNARDLSSCQLVMLSLLKFVPHFGESLANTITNYFTLVPKDLAPTGRFHAETGANPKSSKLALSQMQEQAQQHLLLTPCTVCVCSPAAR